MSDGFISNQAAKAYLGHEFRPPRAVTRNRHAEQNNRQMIKH
jgi:hypothetical protein